MKRAIFAPLSLALAALAVAAALGIGGAGAAAPAGTWELIPAQTDTVGTPVSTYQTVVRPPVNSDGSSVYSAKRGVIPVQFDVLAGTDTPHTIGPVVFESINNGSDPTSTSNTSPFLWSALIFSPTDAMTFADVASLVATYHFTTGDCHGGSLRWTINVQHNGASQNIHVYYGDPNNVAPSFQSCSGSYDESGDNLMDNTLGNPANRFEFQSNGPPVYTSYADMLAATNNGADTVNWIGLILDSGWGGNQVIDPATLAASVNGNVWQRKTEGATHTFSDLAKTCDIPQAKIAITKTVGAATDPVNEVNSVQPKDTGVYFRNVDCKLIYNLDVSTLKGSGDYKVFADFGNGTVNDPALFGLK